MKEVWILKWDMILLRLIEMDKFITLATERKERQ